MAAQSEEYKVQTLFQDCSTLHPAHSTLQYEAEKVSDLLLLSRNIQMLRNR